MIAVTRGVEPPALGPLRTQNLLALRAIYASGREPTSDEIGGAYRVVADALWKAQHFKCCYCEQKIRKAFNDVEHYRPKARADRKPGCIKDHGYWWLAFTWSNLLFACPACNRSGKNDRFPTNHGSVTLLPEASPIGGERPLLLNPADAALNPVEHIKFVYEAIRVGGPQHWWARPRSASLLGAMTIEVCDLNNNELLELRNDHFRSTIELQVLAVNAALDSKRSKDVLREFERALQMITPTNPYVALTYDAMRATISGAKLRASIQRDWPAPNQVGVI